MEKPSVTAIPVCCNRVAYHFAWCTHVLLVETTGDKIFKRDKRPMAFAGDWDMARALVALKIDQLVCGAMPAYFRDWFESKGVRVIDCRKDAPQELFERFREHVLETERAGRKISADHAGSMEEPNQYPKERESG